jgi:hypothetical protein
MKKLGTLHVAIHRAGCRIKVLGQPDTRATGTRVWLDTISIEQ